MRSPGHNWASVSYHIRSGSNVFFFKQLLFCRFEDNPGPSSTLEKHQLELEEPVYHSLSLCPLSSRSVAGCKKEGSLSFFKIALVPTPWKADHDGRQTTIFYRLVCQPRATICTSKGSSSSRFYLKKVGNWGSLLSGDPRNMRFLARSSQFQRGHNTLLIPFNTKRARNSLPGKPFVPYF